MPASRDIERAVEQIALIADLVAVDAFRREAEEVGYLRIGGPPGPIAVGCVAAHAARIEAAALEALPNNSHRNCGRRSA